MKNYFILTFILLFSFESQACDCWGPGNFCDVVKSDNTWLSQNYVVKGMKIRDYLHGMEIKVIENYGLDLQTDTIRVWGDLGWLCREYTSGFAVSDTFVFNLLTIGDNAVTEDEDSDDFQLSFCGIHFLFVKNGLVQGPISEDGTLQQVQETNFDEMMLAGTCEEINMVDDNQLNVEVGPNPFSEEIIIFSAHNLEKAKLIDLRGCLIKEEKISPASEHRMELEGLEVASGCYFLRVSALNGSEETIKIIKH